MTETQDWSSGQGAYPRDLDTWTLTMSHQGMMHFSHDERIVRHLSTQPTLDEIRSLCDDEMGSVDGEVRCSWFLEDPDSNETSGSLILKPTGGAA